MSEHSVTVSEMDTVKLIAEAAAQAAASRVAKQVSDDTRKEFEALEHRLEQKLTVYFGENGPNHHIVQHGRIDRLLDIVDKASVGIIGTIIKYAVVMATIVAALMYLAWYRIQGLWGG